MPIKSTNSKPTQAANIGVNTDVAEPDPRSVYLLPADVYGQSQSTFSDISIFSRCDWKPNILENFAQLYATNKFSFSFFKIKAFQELRLSPTEISTPDMDTICVTEMTLSKTCASLLHITLFYYASPTDYVTGEYIVCERRSSRTRVLLVSGLGDPLRGRYMLNNVFDDIKFTTGEENKTCVRVLLGLCLGDPLRGRYMLNNVFDDIKFTTGEENNGKLASLDILISRLPDEQLQTEVFRKAIHKDQIFCHHSNHPNCHKRGCIRTLFKRIAIHCSTTES
ncbi:hypothetical protein T265_11789 [Opisthorchis viverrini]|uniref:Helix-turn-helix domain-containing protein n=1 Tax=Opisthorchis viverrini TaxID=6198 RepID=A0A074YXA9_OPIVI|nr:hypothetical protein T265_11789 [Opisthorchis viverrini]KER19436.1 hypothetical protein T265_11789 [Opisthorchis viverrini]